MFKTIPICFVFGSNKFIAVLCKTFTIFLIYKNVIMLYNEEKCEVLFMNTALKLTTLVLSLVLVFSLFGVGCGKTAGTPVNETVEFESLPGNLNTYLYDNPDRGYRTEMVLTIKEQKTGTETDWRTLCVSDGIESNRDKMQRLFDLYLPGAIYKPKLVIMYIGLGDYRDKDISEGALEILDLFFEQARKVKVKGLFRIGYHGVIKYDHRRDETSKIELAKICATEEIMLRHIDQLAPFIAKNKDAIHKLSSGFIGMGGEMAYGYQYPIVNYNTVITAVIEKLCIPNGFYYSVRSPKYKLDLLENDPDFKYADLIGFNNDAIWGEQENPNWNSGCWQINHNGTREEEKCEFLEHHANDWWSYCIKEGYKTPQSGEMLVNPSYIKGPGKDTVPTGLEVIKELAHFRYNTMSQWHTLGENRGTDNVMQRWIENEQITPEILDNAGIQYDPSWFTNANGEEIYRNPYEFIRDHLGYKLEAQKAVVKGNVGKGASLNIALDLKNYGFSAAFCLKSGFAVLDDNYNVVSTVEAGEPEKWYGLAPDYFTTERNSSVIGDLLTHTVSADLTLPEESGKYHIAFYLKNDMNDFACLSNDMSYEGDGYNILYSFEI